MRSPDRRSDVDPRFALDPFEPAYSLLSKEDLVGRVRLAQAELTDCRACPRDCGVDRTTGELGTCNIGRDALVASAFPHFGEEDCLRGRNGSGTIFFGGCNLRCQFCQNWDISQHDAGEAMPASAIADLMLALQERECHNINFVTPEHVVPQVVEAVSEAIPRGLRLPIVYNTSGYDSVDSLALLDGIVDIYMPDFKFWEPATARRLARAGDYPEHARAAISEMHRQVGVLRFGPDGLARRGVLVRHLVMPGMKQETATILEWLASELSADTYVNIMGQYRPEYRISEAGRGGESRYPDIDRRPSSSEMSAALDAASSAGLWRLDQRA